MLYDLQAGLAPLAQGHYDVCVCGSGPAGITVARELAAGGKRVALLEAGGLVYSEQSQSHYEGTESGLSTYELALKHSRLRYFGGTSNHWTGLCGLLSESDFRAKPYFDLPGWPITKSDISVHNIAANAVLGLPNPDMSDTPFGDAKQPLFDKAGLYYSDPMRFGSTYRKEIAESGQIDLFLNANLVDLHMIDGLGGMPTIDYVLVSNYRKETAKVIAKRFVLGLGSIENARMLLSANKQLAAGIGNHSDFVGRCYMEHLNVHIGRLVTRRGAAPILNNLNLAASEQLVRRLNIGNGILSVNTNYLPSETGRLGPVRGALRAAACESQIVRDFARRFKDFDCAGDGTINSLIEQAPDRNSRVTLTRELDSFGLPRAHVHWVLNDADRRTVSGLGIELAKTLLKLDVARVQLSDFITDPRVPVRAFSHAHQMGTTRMSVDPRFGVVDANCQVHGVSNLFLAGSSVFPSGGGVNPTLTIVMLALRLAKHLRRIG